MTSVVNEYSQRWFRAWLDTVPGAWTLAEVAGVVHRLPLPGFRRVLDVCCGPGRHAAVLSRLGYSVVGVDRDEAAVVEARRRAPSAEFAVCDQRSLRSLDRCGFDAAMILWQSFGYFDADANDAVLADLASSLRVGGRLLLDVYHPDWVAAHVGRSVSVRSSSCIAVTNAIVGDEARLRSTIEYDDGTIEEMDFELFFPDALAERARRAGFDLVEECCWWDPARPPDPGEQRYQLVLERR